MTVSVKLDGKKHQRAETMMQLPKLEPLAKSCQAPGPNSSRSSFRLRSDSDQSSTTHHTHSQYVGPFGCSLHPQTTMVEEMDDAFGQLVR